MFRYLIFDLDGTVLDTTEIIMQCFELTLKNHLNYSIERQELLKIYGEPLLKQMTYFSPERAEELCEIYRQYYAERSREMTQVFPGVREVFRIAKQHNIPIAIVTNKGRQPALTGLKDLGLWQYVDFLIGGNEVTHTKPHPEALLKAMEQLQAIPEETLMIGDSPIDIETAHRANVKSALVNWTTFAPERFQEFPPDYRLVEMTQLLQMIQTDVA